MRKILAFLVVTAIVGTACSAPQGSPRVTQSSSTSPAASPSGPIGSPTSPRTLTFVAAGDVLVHPPVWRQAQVDGGVRGFDFFPIFAAVSPIVSGADLAICHLETPLADAAGPFAGFPNFNAPPQVLDGLRRAGFDACSTASNHTLDQGAAGVRRTADALDAAGLGHAGSARSAAEAATPTIYRAGGVRVGHLAYTAHLNGQRPPTGREWLVNVIDPDRIRSAARRLRAAGAEIVVLSLHWGTEYQAAPDAGQLRWARSLITAPEIDLIIGHHAHVVQPFEKIGDEWVVYGMGNQVARHADPVDASREGTMARITFTETAPGRWRTSRVEAVPTWVQIAPAIRLVDLAEALRDPATPAAQRAIYQAAYDRVVTQLNSRGAAEDGLVIAP